jgi:hypothetical protein
MTLYDSQIIENIYDTIFKNDQYDLTDFIEEFPSSYIDNANATIYLCDAGGNELFKVKIERV